MWILATAAISPFLSAASIAKLTPQDGALVAALAQSLLLQHPHALDAAATAALAQAVVLCCVHWSPTARRAGRAALSQCIATAPACVGESPPDPCALWLQLQLSGC